MMPSSLRMQREGLSRHLATNVVPPSSTINNSPSHHNGHSSNNNAGRNEGSATSAHHRHHSNTTNTTTNTTTTTVLPAGSSGEEAVRRRNPHHPSQHRSSDQSVVASGGAAAVLPDKLANSSHILQMTNGPNSSSPNAITTSSSSNSDHNTTNQLHHSSPACALSASTPVGGEQHNSTVIVEATPPRRVGSALNFVRSTVPPASGSSVMNHNNNNTNNHNHNNDDGDGGNTSGNRTNNTDSRNPEERGGGHAHPHHSPNTAPTRTVVPAAHRALPTTKVTPPNSQRSSAQPQSSTTSTTSSSHPPPPPHSHHPSGAKYSGEGGVTSSATSESTIKSLSFSSEMISSALMNSEHQQQQQHHQKSPTPPSTTLTLTLTSPTHTLRTSPVHGGRSNRDSRRCTQSPPASEKVTPGRRSVGGSRPPENGGAPVGAAYSSTQGSTLSSSTATTVMQDEDTAYLESQHVSELVAQLYQSVVSEKPEEPIQFIIEQLRHPRGSGAGDDVEQEKDEENDAVLRGELRRHSSLHNSITAANNGNIESSNSASKTTSPVSLRKPGGGGTPSSVPTTNTTAQRHHNRTRTPSNSTSTSSSPPPPIALLGGSSSSATNTPVLSNVPSPTPAPPSGSAVVLGPTPSPPPTTTATTTTVVAKPKSTTPEPVCLSPCPPKVTSPSQAKNQLKNAHKKKTAGQVVIPVRPPSPLVTLSMSGPMSVPRTRPSSHHQTPPTPVVESALPTSSTRPTLSPLSEVMKSPSLDGAGRHDDDNDDGSTTITQTVSWDTRRSSYTSMAETSPSPTHTTATTTCTTAPTTSCSPSNGIPSREMTRSPSQAAVTTPSHVKPPPSPSRNANRSSPSAVASPPLSEEGKRKTKPKPIVLQLDDEVERGKQREASPTNPPPAIHNGAVSAKAEEEIVKRQHSSPDTGTGTDGGKTNGNGPTEEGSRHVPSTVQLAKAVQPTTTLEEGSASSPVMSPAPSPPLVSSSPPPVHVLTIPEFSTSTPPLPVSCKETIAPPPQQQRKKEEERTRFDSPLQMVVVPPPEEERERVGGSVSGEPTKNAIGASPHQKPPRPVSNGAGGRSRQRSALTNSIANNFVNALQRVDSLDTQMPQKTAETEELQQQNENIISSSSVGGGAPLPGSTTTSTPHMLLSDLIGGLESPPPPSACGAVGCNSSMGSLGLRASSAPRAALSAGGSGGGLLSSQRVNSMMRIPSFNSSSRSWVMDNNKGELRSSSSDLSVFSCGSVDVQEFLTDFKQAKVQCLKEKQQLISLDDLVAILDNVNVPLPDITLLSDLFDELRLPPRGVPMVLEKPQAPLSPPIHVPSSNTMANANGNTSAGVQGASQKKHPSGTTAPPAPPIHTGINGSVSGGTSGTGSGGSGGTSKPSSQKSNDARAPLIRPTCADECSASFPASNSNSNNNNNNNNTTNNASPGGMLSTSASFPVVQMTDGGVSKTLPPSSSHSTISEHPTSCLSGTNTMVNHGNRLTPNSVSSAGGGTAAARSVGVGGGSSSPLWVTVDDAALLEEEEEDPGDGTEGEERVEFQTFLARMAFMIHGRYPQEVIRSVFYAMVEDMDRHRIRVTILGKDWLDSTFTAFPLYGCGGAAGVSLGKADMAQFGVTPFSASPTVLSSPTSTAVTMTLGLVRDNGTATAMSGTGTLAAVNHPPHNRNDGGLPPLHGPTPVSPSSPVVLSAVSTPPTASSPDPMGTTTTGVSESMPHPTSHASAMETTTPGDGSATCGGGLDDLGEATVTATSFIHLSRTVPLYVCVMDGVYRRLGMRQLSGVHVQQALRHAHLPEDDLQWECHVNDFIAIVQALTQILQPLSTTTAAGFAAAGAGGQVASPYMWPTAASSASSSRSGGRPPTQNFTSSFQ